MEVDQYRHQFAAHCESGVISSMFENEQIELSEPMSFGIGSGLFFIFIPFVKVMGNPIVSYRSFPGSIFKKCCKRLGVRYKTHRFWSEQKGVQKLDSLLAEKKVIGIQTNIFWLNYIPKNFRFHFNAHNLIVLKKDQNQYLVSDPLLEDLAYCDESSMKKARFSKGPLAPKGFVYYLEGKNNLDKLEKAIYRGIKETVYRMLYAPVPYVGIKGIKTLSQSIKKYPKKLNDRKARLYLANIVRMQEEIGTGGGGFRYLYAGFLNESGVKLQNQVLLKASEMMEVVADQWRQFATLAARECRRSHELNFDTVSAMLDEIAEKEREVYYYLKKNYL